ncbi:gastrotropin-like [Hypomesus transpacificus]|uniref:gastrotropin-like n=1 Tax=Hypomesus transpacificus TaxID=137520 RepID=UPI001F074806|nr:gastrotropin-like [Hypomesus transpacificus]
MAFSGTYELESQQNYEEFLAAIGLLNAKTDHKVVSEVSQEGQKFTWTQKIPNWTWTNIFTIGQETELETMLGTKFRATPTMDGGKLTILFPEYVFTAEMDGEKLVMHCVTQGEKSVTFSRINRRI